MKSAAGERPPDEAHGAGKEAIRPRQLCLRESRKEGAHVHAAQPAEVRATLILLCSEFKNSAKLRQTFSHVCVFIFEIRIISWNCCLNFQNVLLSFPDFQQFLQNISNLFKSLRFSTFLKVRNENC